MPEIIPAIIAKNFEEVKEMVTKVEHYIRWVHIDIMDGAFVPNLTWNNSADLRGYSPEVFLEAHLMIAEPEKHVEGWINGGVKRIIFHFEATSNHHDIIQLCRKKQVEVGVAVNPETNVDVLNSLDELIDTTLFLGVSPGFGGQKFKPEVIQKIKQLHTYNPRLTIGVDGGMNPITAREVVEAGASIIVAGSYIFGSDNIEKAIEEMKEAIAQ